MLPIFFSVSKKERKYSLSCDSFEERGKFLLNKIVLQYDIIVALIRKIKIKQKENYLLKEELHLKSLLINKNLNKSKLSTFESFKNIRSKSPSLKNTVNLEDKC